MSRQNRWFQPKDGIAREVIQADIHRYLGQDATVRPGVENGTDGYWITAYRTLTTEMLKDLQLDSRRWEQELSQGRERYTDSATHQARQHCGPSDATSASDASTTAYAAQPGYITQQYATTQASAYPDDRNHRRVQAYPTPSPQTSYQLSQAYAQQSPYATQLGYAQTPSSQYYQQQGYAQPGYTQASASTDPLSGSSSSGYSQAASSQADPYAANRYPAQQQAPVAHVQKPYVSPASSIVSHYSQPVYASQPGDKSEPVTTASSTQTFQASSSSGRVTHNTASRSSENIVAHKNLSQHLGPDQESSLSARSPFAQTRFTWPEPLGPSYGGVKERDQFDVIQPKPVFYGGLPSGHGDYVASKVHAYTYSNQKGPLIDRSKRCSTADVPSIASNRKRALSQGTSLGEGQSMPQANKLLRSSSDLVDESTSDNRFCRSDTQDEIPLNTKPKQHSFLPRVTEYSQDNPRGLVDIPEAHMFREIRNHMEPVCAQNRTCSIEFYIRCDIGVYCLEELDRNYDVLPVLTLTGSAKEAFACTCEDYLQHYWPKLGKSLLKELLKSVQISEETGKASKVRASLPGLEFDATDLTDHSAKTDLSSLHVVAAGDSEDLMEMAGLIVWFVATFRRPKQGALTYSCPSFRRIGDSSFEVDKGALVPISENAGTEDSCWTPMFLNSVIAKGFPIPGRNGEIGLEISFDIMLILGRIWYPMEYLDGMWHFISSENLRKKLQMRDIGAHCTSIVENIDIEILRRLRAFVGWTPRAKLHAGTRTSGFETIADSNAPLQSLRPRVNREMNAGLRANMSFFGVQLRGSVVFTKSLYGPVRREYILLEDRLLNAKTQPILVWDVLKKCGWLISEISVALMIAHVWARRQPDQDSLLNKLPYADYSPKDGESAYEAIQSCLKLDIRSKDDAPDELPFKTLIDSIFARLESRKEEVILRDDASAQLPRVSCLNGWELTDIAYSKQWFREKRVSLNGGHGNWLSKLNKRSEILTLFCREMRDLITPQPAQRLCRTWSSVPKGNCYVAATALALKSLPDEFTVQLPAGGDIFGHCPYDNESCQNRLQENFAKASSQRSQDHPITSAIIIGKMSRRRRRPCVEPNIYTPSRADTTTESTSSVLEKDDILEKSAKRPRFHVDVGFESRLMPPPTANPDRNDVYNSPRFALYSAHTDDFEASPTAFPSTHRKNHAAFSSDRPPTPSEQWTPHISHRIAQPHAGAGGDYSLRSASFETAELNSSTAATTSIHSGGAIDSSIGSTLDTPSSSVDKNSNERETYTATTPPPSGVQHQVSIISPTYRSTSLTGHEMDGRQPIAYIPRQSSNQSHSTSDSYYCDSPSALRRKAGNPALNAALSVPSQYYSQFNEDHSKEHQLDSDDARYRNRHNPQDPSATFYDAKPLARNQYGRQTHNGR